MTEDWPERVFRERLVQPDRVSCGATCLVVARMIEDHAYGEYIGAAPSVADRFRAEVLAMHRRVTAPADGGRLQVPWPRALGTPPWAVARQLGDRDVRWLLSINGAAIVLLGLWPDGLLQMCKQAIVQMFGT